MLSKVVRSQKRPEDEWRVSVVRADAWIGNARVHRVEEKVRLFVWSDPGLVIMALIFIYNLVFAGARRLYRRARGGYTVTVKEYWPLQLAASWPLAVYRSEPMSREQAEKHQRHVVDIVRGDGIGALIDAQ